MTPAERQAALDEAATAPKRVTIDGNTVETHDPERIAAVVERNAANANASGKHRGLKFGKMRSPGTV